MVAEFLTLLQGEEGRSITDLLTAFGTVVYGIASLVVACSIFSLRKPLGRFLDAAGSALLSAMPLLVKAVEKRADQIALPDAPIPPRLPSPGSVDQQT